MEMNINITVLIIVGHCNTELQFLLTNGIPYTCIFLFCVM